MPKTEHDLRVQQIQDALYKALKATMDEDWFLALSAIQEAEIILRTIQQQEQLHEA